MADSDLDLIYVGSETEMLMFEGAAEEISEEDFNAALRFAQEACKTLATSLRELADAVGVTKRTISVDALPEEVESEAKTLCGDRLVTALLTPAKLEREAAFKAVAEEVGEKLVAKFGEEVATDSVLKEIFYKLQKVAVRRLILEQGKRMDGRGFDEVRSIVCEVGLLPRAHGSAVFQRGETQALVLTTLGTTEDSQEFDAYTGGMNEKRFLLHYNFPNFSVGETGRIMGPGRREIGHGALAERSIRPVMPKENFEYAVRATSEILESNGSSSMASICGATLSMMDAGVPLKRPVAGISIGVCTATNEQGEVVQHQLLTDILGAEDGFCDMDCKIAGTEKGITGFQLDLKLPGLSQAIMEEAVKKAREARMQILETMLQTLGESRKELSPYAPRIETVKINPDKIGALIGPGGKNIKRIVDETGCEINIDDDGSVRIYSVSGEGMKMAKEAVQSMVGEIEVGKLYRGKVVTIKDFGCFVEVFPGQDGLVHISELANFRVKQVEDIVKIGDDIWVKCLEVDDKGRVRLSRRAAMEERDRELAKEEPATPDTPAEPAE